MGQLLRLTGFLPFVLILFLNAFVDLGHKILIQNTVFKVYDGQTQIMLTAIVNGLILLPFVLLFTPAGYLADRHPKPRLMRVSAAVAVGLTLLITLAYYQGWFRFAFAMTFLLAAQSAFYSPAKYGYIKELTGKGRLAAANAIVQAVTIVAILLGIFVFSAFFERALGGVRHDRASELLQAIAPIGWMLFACATLEFVSTLRLPATGPGAPHLHFDWARYGRGRYLRDNLHTLLANRSIWLSIVGLSVFWGISQVVLAAFPAFAKEALAEDNTVVIQGILACSGVGIMLGSLLAGAASRHHIETGLIPLGALGLDHLPGTGAVLLLGNHISWLDWAMIQIACPRPVRFVMDRGIYQRWYLHRFLDLFGVIPIAPGQSRSALRRINERLRAGEVVCLFPEGAISRNGQLGEFRRGYERTIDGVDGVILPFYLRGLWGSRFSRSSDRLQEMRDQGLRRDVIVAFGRPLPLDTPAHELKRRVFDLSIDAWERYTRTLDPIPLAWLRTARRRGRGICLTDAGTRATLSAYEALTAVIALACLIRRRSAEQNIALMVPTSGAGLITNLAALLLGKTVVNLNYTASTQALRSALDKAQIRSLYTSRRFVRKLAQRGVDLSELAASVQVNYLEDLRDETGALTRLALFAVSILLPARVLYALFGRRARLDQPAAILFSSGSEGEPKGVLLSHRNIMANIRQVCDVLDVQGRDTIMATLPLFHAFGLTVTGLMPLVEGIPVVFHPDPTDALTIAKAIARHRATVFCATSTFLRLFTRNRRIHPLMLDSLRIVVAGAERLSPEVRDAFKLRFNKEVYEGYGTTETTPVASVNLPDRIDPRDWKVQRGNKAGTVGLPLPGGSFRIVDPQTLETLPVGEDGLILFGGTQVMLAYLDDPRRTAEVIVERDGRRWYKTGDKGHLDEAGFLTVVDRYSRFAKIGGEMVSLGAIEGAIGRSLPEDAEILATALPDGKKGEKVVLLIAGPVDGDQVQGIIERSGLNTLMRPSRLIHVEAIPRLGAGKTDFGRARQIAMEACG